MAKREPNYHGILIVDKPGRLTKGLGMSNDITSPAPSAEHLPSAQQNSRQRNGRDSKELPTSHDIVQMARRWCQQKRVGHTGTLDPMASGVLVLCLGSSTRLVEYYQNHSKQYYAEICLGFATDTYDAVGKVTAAAAVPPFTPNDIEAVLADFRGEILQTPPLFSAIKQGGESLHRKARRGESVAIEPRRVTFHQIDLLDFTPPDRLHLRIVCSAGTYIRSLAHDVGEALHNHGYLDVLRREAAGSFTQAQAYTPNQIALAVENGTLAELILPAGFGLTMPTIHLSVEEIQRFGYGQTVLLNSQEFHEPQSGSLAMARDSTNNEFVGIIRRLSVLESNGVDISADNTMVSNTNPINSAVDSGSLVTGENETENGTENNTAWKAEKWFANS